VAWSSRYSGRGVLRRRRLPRRHAVRRLTAVYVSELFRIITGVWLLFLVGVATLGVSVRQVARVAVWVAGSIRWVHRVASASGHPTREGRHGAWWSSLGWASSPREELVWLFVQAGELERGLLVRTCWPSAPAGVLVSPGGVGRAALVRRVGTAPLQRPGTPRGLDGRRRGLGGAGGPAGGGWRPGGSWPSGWRSRPTGPGGRCTAAPGSIPPAARPAPNGDASPEPTTANLEGPSGCIQGNARSVDGRCSRNCRPRATLGCGGGCLGPLWSVVCSPRRLG
jgi:hypothetical protein